MFLSLTLARPPDRLVSLFEKHWREAIPSWQRADAVELFAASSLVLTRAACDSVGVPPDHVDENDLCDRLVGMVENAGRLGPRMWWEQWRRAATEREARKWIASVREPVQPPSDAPIRVIAEHRDEQGRALSVRSAAVELLNLLRPTVAVGRYIVFAAMALHAHPRWRDSFARGNDGLVEPFAEEVRRVYPFFPLIAGTATRNFTWADEDYSAGQW
jgi:fatty-acid peroxygenase